MHLDILMVIKYNYCIKLLQSKYQRGDLVQKRIEKYYDLIVEYLYPNMSENKKVDESSKFKVEVTEPILISYEDVAINSERQLKRLNAYEKAVRSIVSTPELNKLGLQSREIAELVEAGLVERVKQGYYTLPEISGEDSEAKMIWELYPDGVICMTTALFYLTCVKYFAIVFLKNKAATTATLKLCLLLFHPVENQLHHFFCDT